MSIVYDDSREIVEFRLEIDGRSVECGVSKEALDDLAGGRARDPISEFHGHRARIEQVAEAKYRQGATEESGRVFVRTLDLHA